MKIIKLAFATFLITNTLTAQEHFSGISTSKEEVY